MEKLVLVLALVASSTALVVPNPYANPVSPVSKNTDYRELVLIVFFESKCPDSMRFFKEQMRPTFDELSLYFVVIPVPWGKANFTPNGHEGFNFTCQHGPEECQGNRMFACAKHFMINDMYSYANFTTCAMSLDDPPTALNSTCAEIITETQRNAIDYCLETPMGDYFLVYEYVFQDGMAPDLDYVPWMIVNDVHNATLQDKAEHHLKDLVCDMYKGPTPPQACSSR